MADTAQRPDINQLAEWHRQGRLDDAEAGYRAILQIDADDSDALHLLGLICQARGDNEEAERWIRSAIKNSPNNSLFYRNLGAVLVSLSQYDEAQRVLEEARRLDPESSETHYNLGTVHHGTGALDRAAACYRRALEQSPGHINARINLGAILMEQDDFEGADALFTEVLAEAPDNPLALKNLARLHHQRGDTARARQLFLRAAPAAPNDPDIAFGLAMTELLDGNYAKGWPLYESRYAIGKHRKRFAEIPEWGPDRKPGETVLIHTEQGYGDVIQFARFAPLVADHGFTVVLYAHKPLAALLGSLPKIDRVVPWGEPLPPLDTQAALLSLPRILGLTLDQLPGTPYLTPAAARKPDAPIGVCLGTNSKTATSARKSLSTSAIDALLSALPTRAVNLQKDVTPEQRARLLAAGVADPTAGFRDFSDTAATIAGLEVVLSVDTAVAHLAGAMGKPVLLMLPYARDWRWLDGRNDSPWYPSMRLFRQEEPGAWRPVTDAVISALENMPLNRHSPARS